MQKVLRAVTATEEITDISDDGQRHGVLFLPLEERCSVGSESGRQCFGLLYGGIDGHRVESGPEGAGVAAEVRLGPQACHVVVRGGLERLIHVRKRSDLPYHILNIIMVYMYILNRSASERANEESMVRDQWAIFGDTF